MEEGELVSESRLDEASAVSVQFSSWSSSVAAVEGCAGWRRESVRREK